MFFLYVVEIDKPDDDGLQKIVTPGDKCHLRDGWKVYNILIRHLAEVDQIVPWRQINNTYNILDRGEGTIASANIKQRVMTSR